MYSQGAPFGVILTGNSPNISKKLLGGPGDEDESESREGVTLYASGFSVLPLSVWQSDAGFLGGITVTDDAVVVVVASSFESHSSTPSASSNGMESFGTSRLRRCCSVSWKYSMGGLAVAGRDFVPLKRRSIVWNYND